MALEATQVVNGTEILLGLRRWVFRAVRFIHGCPGRLLPGCSAVKGLGCGLEVEKDEGA